MNDILLSSSILGLSVFSNSTKFSNESLSSFPIDPIKGIKKSASSIPNSIFSTGLQPDPLESPELVAWSADALRLIGIQRPSETADDLWDRKMASFFGGHVEERCSPASHRYGGHQFGSFNERLGDGTVMYLSEVITPVEGALDSDASERNNEAERVISEAATAGEPRGSRRYELQLKGIGRTPYSRDGDGRKVFRSSLREFLASEAMYYLGIPTVRAGTLVTSRKTTVKRDLYYTNDVVTEPCAVVSRIAPTFFRFGSFEIFRHDAAGSNDAHLAEQLLNLCMFRYIKTDVVVSGDDEVGGKAVLFLEHVVSATAKMIALWQSVGFVHGVMNTDNMSILGITIDYGPFGFMEEFDPDYVPNGSDDEGRYAYKEQPYIGKWNCLKLAQALDHANLLPSDQGEHIVHQFYDRIYNQTYTTKLRSKLGLLTHNSDLDQPLFDRLFHTMQQTSSDFTHTFLALQIYAHDTTALDQTLDALLDASASSTQQLKSTKRKIKIMGHDPNATMLQFPFLSSNDKRLSHLRTQIHALQKTTAKVKKQQDKRYWKKFLSLYRQRLLQDHRGIPVSFKGVGAIRLRKMKKSNPVLS